MITGVQIRMARSALRWRVSELAEKVDIPWARMQVVERVDGVPSLAADLLEKLKNTFEKEGISFISEEEGGAGVIYRKR